MQVLRKYVLVHDLHNFISYLFLQARIAAVAMQAQEAILVSIVFHPSILAHFLINAGWTWKWDSVFKESGKKNEATEPTCCSRE